MLIFPGTEEMGSDGRRRRPTRIEELRRRRRRLIEWSSRRDEPFFRDALTSPSNRLLCARCFKILVWCFLTSIWCLFIFCLLVFDDGLCLNFWSLVWRFTFYLCYHFLGPCDGQNTAVEGRIAAGFLMRCFRFLLVGLCHWDFEFTWVIFIFFWW